MIFMSLSERIAHKLLLDHNTGCWLWTGSLGDRGYAKIKNYDGTSVVHKILYERKYGPVPDGLELDHKCRVRRCVNPDHVEPVTHFENMSRSTPAQKTFCKHGHPFDETNTRYTKKGHRACRKCAEIYSKEYKWWTR